MKITPILLTLALSAAAQTKSVITPPPTLSAAETKALTDIAADEQELQKKFQADEQLKAQILRDWATAHPGWELNPQTGAVTKVDSKETKK
jgi:hypothetical protein